MKWLSKPAQPQVAAIPLLEGAAADLLQPGLSRPYSAAAPEEAVSGAAPTVSIKTRTFLSSAAIFVVLLAGLNVLIHFTARKSQRQQLLARLDHLPANTDILFLGNSLVEAGCDVEAFNSAWADSGHAPAPQNVALGGTSPVEHYLIFKRALERTTELKYIVYGFFDDQLNAPSTGDWQDLVGNRALSYYFPKEAAALYAPGSTLKIWELWLIGHIPMLAERSSLWAKVELLRRRFEEIGMPKKQTNRFGRVQDFAALEARDVPSFVRRCQAIVDNRPGFSPALHDILGLANQHGIKVILVEMPLPSRHRQLFYATPVWSQMRDYLQSSARQQNAEYISASDWVPDDSKFEDATHLNEEGAKLFSAELAVALSDAAKR